MTTELEDRIRASLQQRGETIHVEVPEPDLTRRFAAKSRTRRLELAAVAAALALFVGAGLLVALAGRESSAPPSSDYLTPTAPAGGELSRVVTPGALVWLPSPWRLQRFTFVSAAAAAATQSPNSATVDGDGQVVPPGQATTEVEYGFADDARTFQLHFYPLGSREPTVTTPEPPLVEIRGTTGYYLDYGAGRYRIQWDEGGRTWDVDGNGFATLDDLAATVDTLRWEGDTDWAAAAPTGLADAILANPDAGVGWYEQRDPQLVVQSAWTSPTTTVPVTPDAPNQPALTGTRCEQQPQPTLVIYMRTDASASDIAGVDQYLRTVGGIESYAYLDQAETYAEFARQFADSPEMVASVTPADLPTSFTVVAPEATARALSTSGLPGIKTAIDMPCSAHP